MNVDLELLLAESRLATVRKLFPVLLHHLEDEFPHLGVLGQHLVKKDQIEESKMLKAIKIHSKVPQNRRNRRKIQCSLLLLRHFGMDTIEK